MSLYDYKMSQEIRSKDYPFYALIMAAIGQADTMNLEKLKFCFPFIFREFEQRYHAGGGVLESDPEWLDAKEL